MLEDLYLKEDMINIWVNKYVLKLSCGYIYIFIFIYAHKIYLYMWKQKSKGFSMIF